MAIDGRTDVHHADEVRQCLRVWNGEPEWASDPELAAAVVSHVGIYDMLRTELDPNGSFNTTEYGSVKDAA